MSLEVKEERTQGWATWARTAWTRGESGLQGSVAGGCCPSHPGPPDQPPRTAEGTLQVGLS